MKGTTLVVLSLVLICGALANKGDLLVGVRNLNDGKEFQALGRINYDIKGSLSSSTFEPTNSDLYSTILKSADTVYQFEFKFDGTKRPSLKTAIKIPKKSTSLGFQVHANANDYINAVNVLTDNKLKQPFSKVHKFDHSDGSISSFSADTVDRSSSYSSSAVEDDDLPPGAHGIPKTDPKTAAELEKAREKEKKKQPWYKEYFWYIIIGGFFVYRIATMDKTQFKEQLDEARKKAEQAQASAAPRK